MNRQADEITPATGHDPTVLEYVNDPAIARGYDAYHYSNNLFRTDTEFLDDALRDSGVVPPEGKVLDLGCGTGRHVVHLAALGFRVTGVDLSAEMLRLAARKLERVTGDGRAARLLRGDICRLDEAVIADGEFDAAICMFSTLGMVRGKRRRRAALAGWRRALRPGGLLVVHVHNLWYNLVDPYGRRWLLGHILGALLPWRELGDRTLHGYRGLASLYLHLFRLGELRRLVMRAGFRLERELLLNDARTGPVAGRLRGFRANGFLVSARKPT